MRSDGLIVLSAYASLAAQTLLQRLPACLNFTLDSGDLFFLLQRKKVSPELWQLHKVLKTMEMSEA